MTTASNVRNPPKMKMTTNILLVLPVVNATSLG